MAFEAPYTIQLSFIPLIMTTPFLDLQGNPIPQENILGSGSSALVLLQGDVAVKIPLKCLWTDTYEIQAHTRKLKHEQEVYRRLQDLPCDNRSNGVIRCLQMSDDSTHFAYMPNGDLQSYLANFRPSQDLQFSWCFEITRTLTFIHDRCILVTDIASRNFLLDSDLSIKFCDFSEASILPLGSDMKTANDRGFDIQIDIGLLGTVIYEIITGKKVRVELFENNSSTNRPYWPKRESLPKTTGISLGWIIEGCWNGQFQTAHCVLQALDNARLAPLRQSSDIRFGQTIKDSVKAHPYTAVIGVVGLVLLFGKSVASQFRSLR